MLFKLFIAFIQVGLFSVGGGYAAIPLIKEQVVETYKLMTLSEFTDLITIAEMTPGPIAINSATFVGTRLSGFFGALVCTVGCIIPSFIICLILAHFYYKYRDFDGVQKVLAALRPAVVALIASAGTSILILGLFSGSEIILSDFKWVEFLLFAVCLFVLQKFKANAISIILGSGIAGTLIYSFIK